MKVTLSNIEFKGKYFDEVVVDIPQVTDLAHDDANWMIRYLVTKELNKKVG